MSCLGITFCTKKACVENDKCVLYFTRHIPFDPILTPKKGKRKKHKRQKRDKNKRPGSRITRKFPPLTTFTNGSTCALPDSICNKIHTCKILGQCILNHDRVKGNAAYEELFREPLSVKACAKLMQQQMPTLERFNHRLYKKPEWLIRTILKKKNQ